VIRGLRCIAPDSRRLLVDIIAVCDLGPPARSDDMADAVDIAEVAATVRNVIADRPRTLLESLVVDCGTALLARFNAVETLELRITSPEPAGLHADAEVVEVTLSR
jgi:dihydroneopterin aldolase